VTGGSRDALVTRREPVTATPRRSLGVEHFGHAGTMRDLYRSFGIDREAILAMIAAQSAGPPLRMVGGGPMLLSLRASATELTRPNNVLADHDHANAQFRSNG
jgi:hypothetical protein